MQTKALIIEIVGIHLRVLLAEPEAVSREISAGFAILAITFAVPPRPLPGSTAGMHACSGTAEGALRFFVLVQNAHESFSQSPNPSIEVSEPPQKACSAYRFAERVDMVSAGLLLVLLDREVSQACRKSLRKPGTDVPGLTTQRQRRKMRESDVYCSKPRFTERIFVGNAFLTWAKRLLRLSESPMAWQKEGELFSLEPRDFVTAFKGNPESVEPLGDKQQTAWLSYPTEVGNKKPQLFKACHFLQGA